MSSSDMSLLYLWANANQVQCLIANFAYLLSMNINVKRKKVDPYISLLHHTPMNA